MSSSELLKSLLVGRWEQIVTQGGVLERSPNGSVYLLSGLWIFCLSRWIEISAIDEDDDKYDVGIYVCDTLPVPEQSKLYMPPRKLVSKFPSACPIDLLSTGGVISVNGFEFKAIEDNQLIISSPLIVHGKGGLRFRIQASKEFPGNIELSLVNSS